LALCFEYGKGVEINYEEAHRYYFIAASQGKTNALYNLALCYEYGKGV